MKKMVILFLLMFLNPLFASGIDANATDASCDNTTLETYSGTADVEINWIPNTIQTRWYNGNTLMDVQTSANTCVYDDVLNRPTNPTRTGYTFTGWTVRPKIDFATQIPKDSDAIERWAIGVSANNANYCWHDTNTSSAVVVNCDSDSTYNELQTHEWKVRFEHGDLYGMARCSTIPGTHEQPGAPTIGSGQYCWCKATGYKATNANVLSGPLSTLSWVFCDNNASVDVCALYCATHCSYYVEKHSTFRTALLTLTSN